MHSTLMETDKLSTAHHRLTDCLGRFWVGRNPCRMPGSDAAAPMSVVSLLGGRSGYPCSVSCRVSGETLGPVRWFGQQRRVNVAVLLEGVAGMLDDLWAWWCGVVAMPFSFQGVECRRDGYLFACRFAFILLACSRVVSYFLCWACFSVAPAF